MPCHYHSLTPPLLHLLFLQWESKGGHWKKGEESAKKKEAEGGPQGKGFCNPWVVLGDRLRCRVCDRGNVDRSRAATDWHVRLHRPGRLQPSAASRL